MNQATLFQTGDIAAMDQRYRAKFINSLSGFKSVNLVGTANEAGQTNLSIVSSVIHIGTNPPLMGFIMRPITVTRDTYNNILATEYYTFNHITEAILKPGHQTSARYPAEESEFDATGLTPFYSEGFPAPYVAESPVRMGLAFREKIDIQLNGTIMMIGEIMEVWAPEEAIAADGYLAIDQAGSLTCSGLDAYHRTEIIARLSYAKAGQEVREM